MMHSVGSLCLDVQIVLDCKGKVKIDFKLGGRKKVTFEGAQYTK